MLQNNIYFIKLNHTGSKIRREQLNRDYPRDLVILTKHWRELSWLLEKIYNNEHIIWQIDADYINSTLGYERWGHFKPVRYNSEISESYLYKVWGFFASTDPECLKVWDIFDESVQFMSSIEYKIPKEADWFGKNGGSVLRRHICG